MHLGGCTTIMKKYRMACSLSQEYCQGSLPPVQLGRFLAPGKAVEMQLLLWRSTDCPLWVDQRIGSHRF